MATQEEIEKMVGRATLDPKFRKEVIEDPSAASKELGIKLTAEQEAAFKAEDVTQVAEHLEKVQSKSCYFRTN
jgi:hypothetical protein